MNFTLCIPGLNLSNPKQEIIIWPFDEPLVIVAKENCNQCGEPLIFRAVDVDLCFAEKECYLAGQFQPCRCSKTADRTIE
jgi:hypothetical protein